MKKEVFIAIILGFGIGIFITFGVIAAKRTMNTNPPKQVDSDASVSISLTPTITENAHKITLVSPQEGQITSADTIMVEGTTTPGSTVTVTTEKNDLIIAADENGKFSLSVNIEAGANFITITSFSPTGDKDSKEVQVIQTSAEF